MNKILSLLLGVVLVTPLLNSHAAEVYAVQHSYKLKMWMDVPRVWNNTQSLGYRKYQRQMLHGTVKITYPVGEETIFGNRKIEVVDLYNQTHKDSKGCCITYKCRVDSYFILNLIGSNYKNTFFDPGLMFNLVAEPSYSIGEEVTTDNALYVQLSGRGWTSAIDDGDRIIRRVRGMVTGSLGCGCTDYGHKSPTRVADYFGPKYAVVQDVAPVDGQFSMIYTGSQILYK